MMTKYLKSEIARYLQSKIVRLKWQINTEENKYFTGIRDNQTVLELIEIRQNIKELKYALDQNIEMLSLL